MSVSFLDWKYFPFIFFFFLSNFNTCTDSDIVTAVAWSPDCQLFSCSDDKAIGKWGADGEAAGKITTINVFPSSISFYPGIGKQVSKCGP